MRLGEARTAGRGRRQNLPRALRVARACRRPLARSALLSQSGHRDRPSLATSAGHFVWEPSVRLSVEFDRVSGLFFPLCSPVTLNLSIPLPVFSFCL